MRHTISILVENEFGVLARVAGLFSGRGFNIESLSVAETMDPTVSRITLVTRGDDQVLEQIEKQLNKLIYVIKVTGTEDKIDALIELLKPIGIKEIVRTGRVAMFRGTRLLTVDGKDKERA